MLQLLKKYTWLISFCIFLALGGRLFHWKFLFWLSGVILISGILIPAVLDFVTLIWESIGKFIGKIISGFILSVFFFIFLTPLSLIRRIFGKRTIKDPVSAESNFIIREHTFSKKEFEKTW